MPDELAILVPDEGECETLSALCLRSKAHWGYDSAFMEAVREELAVTPEHLRDNACAVARTGGRDAGYVQVSVRGAAAYLDRLFVEPGAIGTGAGRVLFQWAADRARDAGCTRLEIDSDPQAAGFYEKMGARHAGFVPSASILGRELPFYVLDL